MERSKTFLLKGNEMSNKAFWEKQFKLVEDILKYRFDYDVICMTDEMDRVEFDDKLVYVNSRCHPETKFYTLLHEYGHVELYESSSNALCVSIPCYQTFASHRYGKSHAARLGTLIEEIEAWKLGRMLSIRESLWIDVRKFEKTMNTCLMSYVRWAGKY